MRPNNSSLLPSTYWRSSSVSLAHFCLSLPLVMFQSPLISSLVMVFVFLGGSPLTPHHMVRELRADNPDYGKFRASPMGYTPTFITAQPSSPKASSFCSSCFSETPSRK